MSLRWSAGNCGTGTLIVPSTLNLLNYCADVLYVQDCFGYIGSFISFWHDIAFHLFGLVLCYSFLIRLNNIQEVRFKEEAVLFQLLESFIQKTKMWCETVKYSKNWNKLSKLESVDHPGLGPPKGPTTGNCLKEVAFC